MKNKFLLVTFVSFISCHMVAVDSTPTVSRVRGDQFTPAVTLTQPLGPVGALDTTLNLIGSLPMASSLSDGKAQVMQVLSDGTFIVALSTGTQTVLGKYNALGALQTSSFGVSGLVDLGASLNAQAMMIDTQGRILVAGGNGIGWLTRVSADGLTVTPFYNTIAWSFIAGLAEQTSGKIIAVGFNGVNAQIVRYNLDGSVDASFGTITSPATPGCVILNGAVSGASTLPNVTAGLFSVVVDVNNLIYVAFKTSADIAQVARFTAVGFLDGAFGTSGVATLSYLATATAPFYIAMDLNSNLVIGASSSGSILVTSIASLNGGAASPTFTDATITSASNTLTIQNLITTTDGTVGKIYILGSNSTLIKSRVTRLTNQGVLDTTFNAYNAISNPSGIVGGRYNEFSIDNPITGSTILAGAVSPQGQFYTAGFQQSSGVFTGYISRLFNEVNTYQVAQFPLTLEQGNLDTTFGSPSRETIPGAVALFNGFYRAALQQTANDVIELSATGVAGKILVGMDGGSNSSTQSSMILIRLTNQGVLDGSFGTGGRLTLPNATGTNEYLLSLFEDGSGNMYVTGYSELGAIFRKYTGAGNLLWNADILTPNYKGLGVALQGSNRVLFFTQVNSTTGQISGHSVSTGDLDTTFHGAGTSPGYVLSTDFGLNMGPVNGGLVDTLGNNYIAYKDNTTNYCNAAAIFNSAPGLITAFGAQGIVANIFPTITVDTDNIHLAFDNNYNIIVAVSSGLIIQVALLNASDGSLNIDFNGGAVLQITVPNSSSVKLTDVTGISDGSLILTGYDENTDDSMLVIRVSAAGVLDDTFNSQGSTPGILPIQIGNQLTNYEARVATGLTVQSQVGSNQGNLVLSGYEQMRPTDSTSLVMRVFGQPGTTEVKASRVIITVPGNLDISYDTTGYAATYANGETLPTAGQQVKAIRQVVGTSIMTIISDGTNSWSTRLLSDSTIDTTYGVGTTGSRLIVKGGDAGAFEGTNGMVFDGEGNMIVFGAHADLAGYVKRLNVNTGYPLEAFGGYTGDPSTTSYPAGTVYGLMSSVEAAGQLQNGNIVIAGNINGVGTAMMLGLTGIPSTTFGTNGLLSNGANITSVSVDAQDNLYFGIGYVDTDTLQKVRIMKTNSQGVLDTTFGVEGVVDAAISGIDNLVSIRMVRDIQASIVVAASFGNTAGQIAMRRFLPDGSVDDTFHGGTQLEISFPVVTQVVVTSLKALQDGRTLVSGYQYDPALVDNDNFEYVACVDADGELDSTFGSQTTGGLVTFQIEPTAQYARYLWDMNIQTNGGILLCGAELPTISESTPLTMRLLGYQDIQAVPQFPGFQPVAEIPNILNYFFSGTGIASTEDFLSTLVDGGQIAVDGYGQPIVGGYTTDQRFVLAKFTRGGLLDPLFGTNGIAQTDPISTLLQGSYVAVDGYNDIYIGGISNDAKFILAKFHSNGTIDHVFSGGVTQSAVVPDLSAGGHLAIDALNRPVIGGTSTTGKLVAARFNRITGSPDTFGSVGVASVTVSSLLSGGYVVTDSTHQVIVTGVTADNQLVAVKFSENGTFDINFGTSGYALSGVINGLTAGGSVATDSIENLIIGGYTTDQNFVVVRLRANGTLDTNFGANGIAYSAPANVLTSIGTIIVDQIDRVVVAGPARSYDGAISIIAARFTPLGVNDGVISPSGMGTTGPIRHLLSGGCIAVDALGNIFCGGFTDVPSLLVAELYSGNEIFISDPAGLSPADYKIFHYGNNPALFKDFLAIRFYARQISYPDARLATIEAVVNILDDLVVVCQNQPGWNLIWHTYIKDRQFNEAETTLTTDWPDSADEITRFFTAFNGRRVALTYTPS